MTTPLPAEPSLVADPARLVAGDHVDVPAVVVRELPGELVELRVGTVLLSLPRSVLAAQGVRPCLSSRRMRAGLEQAGLENVAAC